MRLPVLETPPLPAPQLDSGPRSIDAVKMLRISVTDRCNFRCVYCMPEGGVPWLPKQELLTFEEIADVVHAAVELHGIRRFKLTGGEPTLRHGLVDLVAQLRAIRGVEDLSLTTNGFLLQDLADPLKQAGLDRVTISLDSLRPDRFKRITRTGDLHAVLRGIDRAEQAGLNPVKINCVMMRGTNDDELVDFAGMTLDRAITVRFIEYMPLGDAAVMHIDDDAAAEHRIDSSEFGPAGGCGTQDRGDVFVSEPRARELIERELGELLPVDRDSEAGVGPATVYRLQHAKGRVGFISAMSAPFCDTCNRLRLTAQGVLRSCLFEGGEVDVRGILRSELKSSGRPAALARAMTDCVRLKPVVHSHRGNEQMSRIGG